MTKKHWDKKNNNAEKVKKGGWRERKLRKRGEKGEEGRDGERSVLGTNLSNTEGKKGGVEWKIKGKTKQRQGTLHQEKKL